MNIQELAALAKLAVTPGEERHIADELARLVQFAAQLQDADLTDVPPTQHIVPVANVLREDVPAPSMARENLLRQAPASAEGCITVPRALD